MNSKSKLLIVVSIFFAITFIATLISVLANIWTLDSRWTDTARVFGFTAFLIFVFLFVIEMFFADEYD